MSDRIEIELRVSDVRESVAFYRHALGADVDHADEQQGALRIGALKLALVASNTPRAGALTLRIPVSWTAGEMFERATGAGVHLVPSPEADRFILHDPDGNRIEVRTHTDRRARCHADPCPWSASLFHVLVAHRPEARVIGDPPEVIA